jgi:hypothetical protein
MRLSLALALVSMFVSAPVFGAEDDDGGGKKKKKGEVKKEEDKGGGSMDSGTDPVFSEKSEDGPFTPKSKAVVVDKKTGKVEPAAKARPRDPFVVYLEPLIGFGQAIGVASASAQESLAPEGTVITVEAGGRYDVMPKLSLGLRLAWSTANIDQPGGTSLSAAAFAAPELIVEYRHAFSPLTTLPIWFGVGIPVAQGNPDPSELDRAVQQQTAVNNLADAAHGLRDGELYQPKRLPLVLGVGLFHDRNGLDLHAYTKGVFGVNVGPDIADPNLYGPAGTIKANGLSIRNVTLVGGTYEFLAKPALFAGLDAWFSYRAIDPVEFESAIGATQDTFQFMVEPRVGARFGKLGVAAGFLVPVGGPLGEAGINGVRLHANYAL